MAGTEVTLRFPPDLAEQLHVLAVASNHSVEDLVVSHLRAALARGWPAEQPTAGGAGSPRPLQRRDSEALHLTTCLALDRSGRVSLYRHGSSGAGGSGGSAADGGGGSAAAGTDALYRSESAAMYLSAPIISLVEGLLTDETTVGQALRHGDFGLGTLNKLDGELVVLDGVVYQQAASGACRVVGPDEKTPFMSLTFWKPEKARQVQLEMPASGPLQHASLCSQLECSLPSGNIFYAMRVHGRFRRLRLRSVRKQQVDRPLQRAAEDQAEFECNPQRQHRLNKSMPPCLVVLPQAAAAGG
jgi:hypothetical protein